MTAARPNPDAYPLNFDELIEVSDNVLLMLEIVDHAVLGEAISIKQYLRVQGKASELGSIFIPLNRLSLSALQTLMDFCEARINAVPSQSIFEQ